MGGESNREIVFVSFVRACVRASGARRGEAKLCAGVRRDASCSWAAGAPIVLHRAVPRAASCRVPFPFAIGM